MQKTKSYQITFVDAEEGELISGVGIRNLDESEFQIADCKWSGEGVSSCVTTL